MDFNFVGDGFIIEESVLGWVFSFGLIWSWYIGLILMFVVCSGEFVFLCILLSKDWKIVDLIINYYVI